MAAPVATFVQLPSDSSNTGKKNRTQTKVVGSNTVHEHFVVPSHGYTLLGNYRLSMTQQSVQQGAQNGTSTAFLWLQVPVATTNFAALIRRITVDFSASAATAMPTAPMLSFTKFTFTGTASGASVTPVPGQTASPANVMIARTAVTGMTVTLGNDMGNAQVPAILTAVGVYGGVKQVLQYDPQSFNRGRDVELLPGEGLCLYQSVAGTTSDVRRFGVQIEWSEADLA